MQCVRDHDRDISLSELAELDSILLTARETIARAMVNDEPRAEMDLFSFVTATMKDKILPYAFLSESKKPPSASDLKILADGKYLIQYGLQELIAALLFLLPQDIGSSHYGSLAVDVAVVMELLQETASHNSSSHYVSVGQRKVCASLFFILCWKLSIPLVYIIEALFPLLCVGKAEPLGQRDSSKVENRICLNLFSDSRFQWLKKFLSDVLSGLLFTTDLGLMSCFRVFVLSDRTLHMLSVSEAVEPLNCLLSSDVKRVWTLEGTQALCAPFTCIQQMESLCSQLLQLLTLSCSSGKELPAPQETKETNLSYSQQTLQDNLHEALVLLLNRLLFLPPQSSSQYKACYRKYFYLNKFFLSPGFVPLTLKSTKYEWADVERSVDILFVIVRGTQLGAASTTFSIIMEGIMAGVLNLMAIGETINSTTFEKLRKIWRIIHTERLCIDVVAEVAVRACFSKTCASFHVVNRVDRSVSILPSACPTATLLAGLSNCILSWDSDMDGSLQSRAIHSFARHCQALVSSNEEPSVFVSYFEACLSNAPSAAIFGSTASVQTTLEFCSLVSSLSTYCLLWAVVLSGKLLRSLIDTGMSSLCEEKSTLLLAIEKYQRILAPFSDTDEVKEVVALLTDIQANLAESDDCAESDTRESPVKSINELFTALMSFLEKGDCIRLSMVALELANALERASARLNSTDIDAFRETCNPHLMLTTFVYVLHSIADNFTAASVIKAICWIGLYRWDSHDSSVLTKVLIDALLSSQISEIHASGLHPAKCYLPAGDKAAVGKARLLDVFLAWCDYDDEGRTMRNIDDCCLRSTRKSLFSVFSLLTSSHQPDVIQVASLQLIGHYFSSVFPRVSVSQLVDLCVGVFRHSHIELSKAACASMLLCVVSFLTSKHQTSPVISNEEIRSLTTIANSMASYYSNAIAARSSGAIHDSSNEDPDETVRRHGRSMLQLLPQIDPFVISLSRE